MKVIKFIKTQSPYFENLNQYVPTFKHVKMRYHVLKNTSCKNYINNRLSLLTTSGHRVKLPLSNKCKNYMNILTYTGKYDHFRFLSGIENKNKKG
ncbi:hypothetical protein SAMN05192529_102251 [Arachidicoccus rhizosphaerae]|uniref:Uncharacterized protein n=1 Tax=Arachidicoccus rhizosphaerae TaxID=551991 RepID=A0A1H3WBN8_9BACT|nr:hypothetical protein SAMN05192529_102251 [Arachidicoccus rhizosphaerae]